VSSDSPRGRPALRRLRGEYAVCRLPAGHPVDPPAAGFFSLTRTARETSIVCAESNAPAGARVEPGWSLVEVEGPLAFEEIGILSALARPLAEASVPIFVVSTYDTDYLMIKKCDWSAAHGALEAAGFRLADPTPGTAGD